MAEVPRTGERAHGVGQAALVETAQEQGCGSRLLRIPLLNVSEAPSRGGGGVAMAMLILMPGDAGHGGLGRAVTLHLISSGV